MEPEILSVHHAYMAKSQGIRKGTPFRVTKMRKWREYREKTLEEVADAIGITHATLSRIERGMLPYSQPISEGVARELKIDVESLLFRDPENPEAIWGVWQRAAPTEREMIVNIAKTIVKSDE